MSQLGWGQGLSSLSQIILALQAASQDRQQHAADMAMRSKEDSERNSIRNSIDQMRIEQQGKISDVEDATRRAAIASEERRTHETNVREDATRRAAIASEERRTHETNVREDTRFATANKENRQANAGRNLVAGGIIPMGPNSISDLGNARKVLPGSPDRLTPEMLAQFAANTRPGQAIAGTSFMRAPNDPHYSVTTSSGDDDRRRENARLRIQENARLRIQQEEENQRRMAVSFLSRQAAAAGRDFNPNNDQSAGEIERAAASGIQRFRFSPPGRTLYQEAYGSEPPSLGRIQPGVSSPAPVAPAGPPYLHSTRTRVTVSGPPPLR